MAETTIEPPRIVSGIDLSGWCARWFERYPGTAYPWRDGERCYATDKAMLIELSDAGDALPPIGKVPSRESIADVMGWPVTKWWSSWIVANRGWRPLPDCGDPPRGADAWWDTCDLDWHYSNRGGIVRYLSMKFDARRLWLVSQLPGAVAKRRPDGSGILFRFDGGRGTVLKLADNQEPA